MTTCSNCEHYQHIIQNSAAPHVWYNHFCGHPLSTRSDFDCITGEVTREPLNCRDVNRDGNCARFSLKRPDDDTRPVLEAHFDEGSQ
jgi:isopentenyldiphosphate isomerase